MGKNRKLDDAGYEWLNNHKDLVDEVFGDVPFNSLKLGREFILKFNGLMIWNIREEIK